MSGYTIQCRIELGEDDDGDIAVFLDIDGALHIFELDQWVEFVSYIVASTEGMQVLLDDDEPDWGFDA